MSNIMEMIFYEAAFLGVLLSGITLNTSSLGEMLVLDSERWLTVTKFFYSQSEKRLETVKPRSLISQIWCSLKKMNTLNINTINTLILYSERFQLSDAIVNLCLVTGYSQANTWKWTLTLRECAWLLEKFICIFLLEWEMWACSVRVWYKNLDMFI